MGSSSIRFVYFDLGNILVAFDRQAACRNLASLYATRPEEADLFFADQVLNESGLQNELEWGRITEDQFVAKVRSAYSDVGNSVSNAAILQAISDMFDPINSMTEVLRRVRRAGFPLGILSNTCHAHWSWVNSQGYPVMEGPFDAQVLSYQVQSMKPDSAIYHRAQATALEISGAGPSGDLVCRRSRRDNVFAARERGWNAEVCWGGPDVERVLLRYGVLTESAPEETRVGS